MNGSVSGISPRAIASLTARSGVGAIAWLGRLWQSDAVHPAALACRDLLGRHAVGRSTRARCRRDPSSARTGSSDARRRSRRTRSRWRGSCASGCRSRRPRRPSPPPTCTLQRRHRSRCSSRRRRTRRRGGSCRRGTAPAEWHCSHVSARRQQLRRLRRRSAADSCRTSPPARAACRRASPSRTTRRPAPTWHSTHFTLRVRRRSCATNSGFIGRVAHLAAERHRIHVLDASIRRQRDDDDVGDREREDDRPPSRAASGR